MPGSRNSSSERRKETRTHTGGRSAFKPVSTARGTGVRKQPERLQRLEQQFSRHCLHCGGELRCQNCNKGDESYDLNRLTVEELRHLRLLLRKARGKIAAR